MMRCAFKEVKSEFRASEPCHPEEDVGPLKSFALLDDRVKSDF